jgi:hypothetical protein
MTPATLRTSPTLALPATVGWLLPAIRPADTAMPLHHADPVRPDTASCGALLDRAGLWVRAGLWLTHAAACARKSGGRRPCPCVDLCGGCLFWAGWPAEWSSTRRGTG